MVLQVQKMSAANKERDQQCRRSNREAQIVLAGTDFLILTFLFIDIEPCETDQCAEKIKHTNDRAHRSFIRMLIDNKGWQNSKTDKVTARINLDAKALFLFVSFHGGGYLTVKHIAESSTQQADERHLQLVVQNTGNARKPK